MNISEYTEHDLRNAVDVLKKGGVLLYPTDTVWGLGCDATNNAAVEKLRALKGRSLEKAMLVLVDSPARIESYTQNAPDIAFELIETASEPITVIFDQARGLAPGVAAPDGSIGIRVSAEPFSRTLCRALGRPIVSTSANMAGEITPACFVQISEKVKNAVDYVVEYRRDDTTEHLPSHIIKISNDAVVKIIR